MKQCTKCGRLTGYRTCPWCEGRTVPLDNRRPPQKKAKKRHR